MSSLFVVIFLVLFAVILTAVGLGYSFLERQRKKQVEGMLTVVSGSQGAATEAAILRDEVETDPFAAMLAKLQVTEGIPRLLQQAGLDWSPARMVISMAIGGAIGGVVGWIAQPLGFQFISAAVGALGLGGLPYFYVAFKRGSRMGEIESQFPEALDFLARSMRAGHAFSISLEMLGQELPDPLGTEYRTLFNELNLGAPLDVALRNFAARVPLVDVRMFVSAVLLQRQTGGNLSEILIRLAYVIRERFRLKGQVKAASAHGRLTAGVLTGLPVILMVGLLFVAPGYLQSMAKDSDGKWMILGALLAQGLGYYVMRRITDIKV